MIFQRVLILASVVAISGVAGAANGAGTMNPLASIAERSSYTRTGRYEEVEREPRAPDSFAAWGFFNAHFDQKEYMENYVAEEVMRQMLATRPEIAAEFQEQLASDLAFAKDPQARLEFFSRHHPSWDDRLNVYPVMRVARGAVE